MAMAPGHGGVTHAAAENNRRGLAGNIAAANHGGAHTMHRHLVVVEKRKHTARSTGHETAPFASIKSGSARAADGVNVFERINRVEERKDVDTGWQGELKENSGHIRVDIEALDGRQNTRRVNIGVQADDLAVKTKLFKKAALVFDILARGWIVAHQNGGEGRYKFVLIEQFNRMRLQIGLQESADRAAVHNYGRHETIMAVITKSRQSFRLIYQW